SGEYSSSILSSPFMAINSVYLLIFKTNTEYSGLAVMGFDNIHIVNKIYENIFYFPIFLKIEPYNIVISDCSSLPNKFISLLLITKNSQRCLVLQQIIDDRFILDFYLKTTIIAHYEDETANGIWKKTNLKLKHDEITLFRFNHSLVIEKFNELNNESKHTCKPHEWQLPDNSTQYFTSHLTLWNSIHYKINSHQDYENIDKTFFKFNLEKPL
ncbi:15325_t:CDS:2, partial [Dentiscutata heterogama]